jgi:hypothetical protein
MGPARPSNSVLSLALRSQASGANSSARWPRRTCYRVRRRRQSQALANGVPGLAEAVAEKGVNANVR